MNLFSPSPVYQCPLDWVLPELFPAHLRPRLPPLQAAQTATWTVNPRMILQWETELEPRYAQRVPFYKALSPRRPILWVREPLYETLVPYWPSERMLPVLESLLAGHRPADLSQETLQILWLAWILMPLLPEQYPLHQRQQALYSAQFLKENHYLILNQLVNPLQVAAMRSYFRALQQEGGLTIQETDEVVRCCAHNDPFTRFLHYQITPWLNRVLPEPVKPSYTFVSYYEKTGMAPHKDWEQCVWNLSLLIDPQPEEPPALNWPLHIQLPDAHVEARLEPGDAILYQGTEHRHWREPLPPGNKATVTLFHFVAQDYMGC